MFPPSCPRVHSAREAARCDVDLSLSERRLSASQGQPAPVEISSATTALLFTLPATNNIYLGRK